MHKDQIQLARVALEELRQELVHQQSQMWPELEPGDEAVGKMSMDEFREWRLDHMMKLGRIEGMSHALAVLDTQAMRYRLMR